MTADPSEFANELTSVYPRLWLIAVGLVGDRTQAEDIVQDATVVAWQKFGTFQHGTNFGAWMAAIVRRCASNYVRKVRSRNTHTADPEGLDRLGSHNALESPLVHMTPMRLLEDPSQQEFDDDMLQALTTLHEEARCCLLLRIIQELSYAEIAAMMGIPEGTAMSHVHRSKNQIRERLLRLDQAALHERKQAKP